MSLHVLRHPWQVQELGDGTSVQLGHRDLDAETLSILADELLELALESGRPKLYLDFGKVNFLTSVAVGKLIALDRKLREVGSRLIPCNLNPVVEEVFQAVNWPADGSAAEERPAS
jgi:anti-sigma B factor antagonist